MPSMNAKELALILTPLALVCASQWLLSRYTGRKEPTRVVDKSPMVGEEAEDITERVPLARPGDLRGDVTVQKIFVHPIKSFKGISVKESRFSLTGLEYDRMWVVIDARANRVLTARDIPKMVLLTPEILPNSTSPYGGVLRVMFPDTDASGLENAHFEIALKPTDEDIASWEILDGVSMLAWSGFDVCVVPPLPGSPSPHELLSQYLGRDVRLAIKGPRPRACIPCANFPELGTEEMPAHVLLQDIYPIMLASTESLAETNARVKRAAAGGVTGVGPAWTDGTRELVMERFRPNVVLGGAGVPFAEDAWEEIGIVSPNVDSATEPTIKIVSKCTRCIFPNIDPSTAVRDAAVPFKVLAKFRKGLENTFVSQSCFGVHGVPEAAGIIRVGDRIQIRKWYGE